MRKLIIILLALCSAAWGTTLTGTFKDAQGNPLNGTLSMRLPVPATDTVNGIHVPPTPVYFSVINGSLQAGLTVEDVANLQPKGLWYAMRLFDTAGNLVTYGNYIVTGATFNISTAVPTTVTTSNVSYLTPAALNANNVWTGSNTFNGPVTFNQSISASINGTFSAFNAAGADMCAKINATIVAHPAAIVDARQFVGTQPCASNPFANATGDIVLLLGEAVTIQTTAPWVTPSAFDVLIYGSGRGGNSRGTTIQAVAGFPSTCAGLAGGCPILRLGDGTGPAFGHRFENATLDCNSIANCIGTYSTDIQEQSGWYHFSILNFSNIGMSVDGTGNAGAGPFFSENYEVFDGEIYSLTAGTLTTICAQFLSKNTTNNGPRQLQHVTCSGTNGNHIGNGFIFDGIVGHVQDLNSQSATTAYQFSGANPVHDLMALNLQCQNGFAATKCVWIKNPGTGVSGLFIDGVLNGGVTYPVTLQDDTNASIQYTDFFIGLYVVDNGNTYRLSTANTPLPSNSILPGLNLNNTVDAEQSFALNSGKTVQKGDVILFQDRGTTKWNIEYPTNASTLFKIFDNTANIDKIRFNSTSGQSFINSNGTGAVFFNNDASSGTGGFSVCNGGATCNFTVGGAGTTTINAPVTVTSSINGSDTTLVCTMASGVCNANLSHTYTGAPACVASWTGAGTLTGLIKVSSSTTQATATSTVGTDTAQIHFACFGT